MNNLFARITYIFDPLQTIYEHEKVHRKISVLLVFLFVSSLAVIELKRQGLLPQELAALVPGNHFYAVHAAFTVILVLEVISLIFVLPCSFSRSLGKQFEILSLILIRNAFKELSYFPEPLGYEGNIDKILHILSSGFGALLIFALLGVYYKVQKRSVEDDGHHMDLYSFVASKKAISLLLLVSFVSMGSYSVYQSIIGIEHSDFIHNFYTQLILTDILIVLVSQCFNPSAKMMFRNSGYALSTLMIRIALVAPVYYNVVLGAAAILFAILLSLVSQHLFQEKRLA
ncbi:hypothetical protein JWJ90_18640 [Desulfobulbus rhabdoformis]|uniref:hypothetical protein n=1 Tax=Desulfobulbus rhabdoformis TaxID=34032 RepID=UPI0019630F39|nr:hypothetical protein [Desulfobulbus rhabdoformis]MBM9616287.1 hypothetical protein [Desulfobulbus rhabdoformis]